MVHICISFPGLGVIFRLVHFVEVEDVLKGGFREDPCDGLEGISPDRTYETVSGIGAEAFILHAIDESELGLEEEQDFPEIDLFGRPGQHVSPLGPPDAMD